MPRTGQIRVANVLEEGWYGGPGRRVTSVAQVLARNDIVTTVVTPTHESERLRARLVAAGVPVCAVDLTRLSLHPPTLLRYLLRLPYELVLLRRVLLDLDVDIVHVNGSYQFKSAVAARLAGCRVVWHLNDTMMPLPVRVAFRIAARSCADAFIVAGQRVREYYLDEALERNRPIREIHAPVDLNRFAPRRDSTEKTGGGPVVATVANVNPTKGLEHFVDMAAEVHRTHPSVTFRIAGAERQSQEAYGRRLRDRAAEHGLGPDVLEFVGMVADVPDFLANSDVCVFTSIAEASPTAVWEAMACGRPVITTDVGSVGTHIEQGVSGYVVPIRDPGELAARVSELLDRPELRESLGERARAHAVEKLGLEEAARLHRELYHSVARTDSR
ncbi:MAG TPA: glycosyltransferase family 4 protein [Longimicrobiales bacterium]|nr:glycosyltransferase family 4 protein [Longimicrobiales bacterium]